MRAQRLTVFSRPGDPLAELEAAVECSWVLGGLGRLQFSLASRDAGCSQRNLQFGNFVLFEADGLPGWGGLIWPPRSWEHGQVQVQALSAEVQFKRRLVGGGGQAGLGRKLSGSAASLFAQLIELGNEQADLRIEPGRLVPAGDPLSVELRHQSMWDALKELEESSGQEWWLEAEQDADNRLLFRGHWAPRRGRPRNFELVEGKNLALRGAAVEQGELINRVLVLGEGETQPPSSLAVDSASQAQYGATFSADLLETADQAVLAARAGELLRRHAQPRLSVAAWVLGSQAVRQVRLGDSYPVVLESAGFTSRGMQLEARVVAMQYQTAQDVLAVELEQTVQD